MTTSTIQEFTQAEAAVAPPSGKRELSLAQRMALGSRLAELREAAGHSQLEVARKALGFAVSHAAVSRLERGVFGVVDNAQLDKLASFYGSTVESLLAEMEGRTADEEPEEFRSTDSLVVQPGVNLRLMHLRQASGLSKSEMVALLGYSPSATGLLTQWETGGATPRPDTLLDIAVVMKVSASWLIMGRRAKPGRPTLSMRLRAMQKIYGLSNRDVALLADLDMEQGPDAIRRLSRGRRTVGADTVAAVALALDVPVEWLDPPAEGYMPRTNSAGVPEGTSPKAALFLGELAELFTSSVLKDNDIGKLRQRILHELMSAQKPPSNRRYSGSKRTA